MTTTRRLARKAVALCCPLLMAFDPINGDEPLPSSVSAAQAYAVQIVLFHVGQRPDAVACVEVHEAGADYYECTVQAAGYEPQLMFIQKG